MITETLHSVEVPLKKLMTWNDNVRLSQTLAATSIGFPRHPTSNSRQLNAYEFGGPTPG